MTRNIQATDAQGNKVSEPVQINGVDPTSSGGGGGAFEDGDGDGIYTLPNAGDGIDVASVGTDNLTFAGRAVDSILEGETTGLREEHGSVSHSDPGTASDGTWNSGPTDTTVVSFSTAFSSTPTVFAGSTVPFTGREEISNSSTTGVDHIYRNYSSTNSNAPSGGYLAIGPE